VTLTLGWTTLFMADIGEGDLHEEERRGSAPRRTGLLTVGHNITSTSTCVIAPQITDPSSRQRGALHEKERK
jgi:hypothetical protein